MSWQDDNQRGDGEGGPPDLDQVFKRIFGGLLGGGSGKSTAGQYFGKFFRIGVIVLVFIWALLGIYQIDQRERGVVLRLGTFHTILEAGLHWQPRLVDEVYVLNVTEVRTHTRVSTMLTKDENIVDVKISVQYVISSPQDYLLAISDPDQTLAEASESALRHEVGSNLMDSVLVDRRGPIQLEVEERLQNYLDDYTSGLQVVKVNIQEADPPEQVREAFNDAIKAREDKDRLKNEAETYSNSILPQARGQARRLIEEATADRDRAIARADGEADRFRNLYSEYRKAPSITRQRLYIEAMEQVLNSSSKVIIDTDGEGGNLLYLPLDRLTATVSQIVGSEQGGRDEDVVETIVERVMQRLGVSSDSSSRSSLGSGGNRRKR